MVNHDYCPVCSNYLVVRTKYKFSIFSVVTFFKKYFYEGSIYCFFYFMCLCLVYTNSSNLTMYFWL